MSCSKTKTSTSEAQQVVVLVMSSFKDIRDFVFVGYAHNMFDDEEFCLLDDFYQSKNPDFPYNLYAHSIWGK